MRMKLMRVVLVLALLLAVAVYLPGAAPAKAATSGPCDGTHAAGDGWKPISSEADFISNASGTTATQIALLAGNYYLTNDVQLEYSLCFPSGGQVNLCLNGHMLTGDISTMKNTTYLIGTNGNSRNVALCNCRSDVGGGIRVTDTTGASGGRDAVNMSHSACTFNLYDIDISSNCGRVSAVFVSNNTSSTTSTLSMYRCTLSNNKGTNLNYGNDVGVYSSKSDATCVANLHDVTIDSSAETAGNTYCIATRSAGAVCNIYSGTITGKAGYGTLNRVNGTMNVIGGTYHGAGNGVITYPVTLNGAAVTASAPADVGTITGSGYRYDVAGETLTLTADPTSVAFDSALTSPTVKLGDSFSTNAFASIAAGTKLTIDLNDYTLTTTSGAISNRGELTVTDTSGGKDGKLVARITLVNNSGAALTLSGGALTGAGSAVTGAGGGVIVGTGGSMTMTGGKVTGHQCTTYGGGVFVYSGSTFEMSGGEICGNTSGTYGGGVHNAGTFTMTGGKIHDNTAGSHSGGVSNTGTFVMDDGEIHDNTAAAQGGGINLAGASASFEMNGGKIYDNTAATSGGAIYNNNASATVTLNGGEIYGNTATSNDGGGVYTKGPVTVAGTASIYDNSCTGSGGGVYAAPSSSFTMTGGSILSNDADAYCGGLYVGNTVTVALSGGTIADNTQVTGTAGADIYIRGLNVTFNMTGGTVGDTESSNAFWGYTSSGQSSTTVVEISGGYILGGIGYGYAGDPTDTVVNIRSGAHVRRVPESAYGVNIYGGVFGATDNLLRYAVDPSAAVVGSGDATYPYTLGLAATPRANMLLNDSLTLYLYVPTDASYWTAGTPASVVATVGGSAADAELTTDGGYYKIAVPVTAKQMADVVVVTFRDGGGAYLRQASDSVKAYAVRILDDPIDANEATLMTDMLDYGAAAQIYFNYKTDELATAGVVLGTPSSVTLAVDPSATIHTLAYHSANLTLEERIDFSMYFWSARVLDGAEFTYVVTDGVGGATVTSGIGAFTALGSTDLVEARIGGLPLSAMENAVISVTYNDERDSAVLTAADSMANYLARNDGLDIDDAPATYNEDGSVAAAASGNDTSDLYAKVLAFAHAANAYSYGRQV